MASSIDSSSAANATMSPTAGQTRSDTRKGGRGRGRGLENSSQALDLFHRDGKRHDGAGGRRGRGGRERENSNSARGNSNSTGAAGLSTRPPKSQGPGGPQGGALQTATQNVLATEKEQEEEAEVCFICASPVEHYSVAPCNHRTCHICALRMRALYKNKDCAHCRSEARYVVFTDSPSKPHEKFSAADIATTDENIGIKYEKVDIVEDTILLLRYNCPDPSCDVACLGWPDLHRHVRSGHHKKMCDLCTRNKKVFTHEHELFTDKELERHMKKGDDMPGASDQSGFKGHPLCGFCGERFYGDDELYVHCRGKHERCFICDRSNPRHPQYYVNYDSLEQHFKKDHFICSERVCLEKKFVVFDSEIDLKAHQLQDHGNTLSKDVRRDARTVDISSFDYRAPYVQERRGGGSQRESRGRGRGRDPNTDPIPGSSAQPLRRDEQAFQRQMAIIQSAQSVSTRTFGAQLTSSAPATRLTPGSTTTTAIRPLPHVDQVSSQLTSTHIQDNIADVASQDQARRLRHTTVIERASILLRNDDLKLTQFRTSVSSYRTGVISAPALIDSFFALFSDTSSSALGSLVRDVADLYEDSSKADDLRAAWNDWRAINEDYPSLPGPSGLGGSGLPLGWAQVISNTPAASNTPQPKKNTSRVLKLKSSTAQSNRSSTSRNDSWTSASAPSAKGFPGLPRPGPSNPTSVTSSFGPRTSSSATPWLNATSSFPNLNSNSNPGSNRPTPPTSRPASRGPIRTGADTDSNAFPALPPAAKPTSTIFGYGTGMVRRDIGGSGNTSNFSWGAGAAPAPDVAEGQGEEVLGPGKKRGNKGKKQVLVQWG